MDGLGGSLCGLAQPMFQFGEELFDRVQIGRVFRQEEEVRAGRTDSTADSFAFVGAEIVHDHDIAGLSCRDQDVLDVKPEGFPLIGPSKNQGAVMRSWRKAARKVMVCQRPCGTLALIL
jgi:hypothetical protein